MHMFRLSLLFVWLGWTLAGQQLSVLIYDYAGTGDDNLAKAHMEAAFVMRTAGVEISWQTCVAADACNPSSDSLTVLVLLRDAPARDLPATALGMSIIDRENGFSRYAHIYRTSVRRFASDSGLAESNVLGLAIAHELGHVLMGRRHSERGIMKAVWTKQDIDLMKERRLRFTSADRVELHEAITARYRYFRRTNEVAERRE
jgi:hypothetical protein